MLSKVFVSFAEEDMYFVDLLEYLLQFHGLSVWCSNSSLQAGEKWRERIQEAIADVDSLAVVVSSHSASSPWVKREVALFVATKPNLPVMSIRIDQTKLSAIDAELDRYQAVDFSKSYLNGYRQLLRAFGMDFIPDNAIVVENRRTGHDRRSGTERRMSPIDQRLRVGFWKAYQGSTGAGKFDPVDSLGGMLCGVFTCLKAESAKYLFTSKEGRLTPPEVVLDQAIQHVFAQFGAVMRQDGNSPVKNIYIIEDIAGYVCRNYRVEMIDRRGGVSRRKEDANHATE
jgi:hypothetical protein